MVRSMRSKREAGVELSFGGIPMSFSPGLVAVATDELANSGADWTVVRSGRRRGESWSLDGEFSMVARDHRRHLLFRGEGG